MSQQRSQPQKERQQQQTQQKQNNSASGRVMLQEEHVASSLFISVPAHALDVSHREPQVDVPAPSDLAFSDSDTISHGGSSRR
jgi:hypothetical protein